MDRIKDTFGSLSSSMPGNNQKPLKDYCMGRRKERRDRMSLLWLQNEKGRIRSSFVTVKTNM